MTWQPIHAARYPFEHDREGFAVSLPDQEWKAWKQAHPDRCRDCGTTAKLNSGGAGDGAGFELCDDCAQLDGDRDDTRPDWDGWHVSHWGRGHLATEHDRLIAERDRRRATYRRAHSAEQQAVLF